MGRVAAGLQASRGPDSRQAASLSPARSGLLQRNCDCGGVPGIDGECAECRRERLGVQRLAAVPSSPAADPPIVQEVLRSPGQPGDNATRTFMEPRFGHDFSHVPIHAGAEGDQSAASISLRPSQSLALQRTSECGNTPESAGECAECQVPQEGVLQRSAAEGSKTTTAGLPRASARHNASFPACSVGIQAKLTLGRPGDEFEREADRVADMVMRMERAYERTQVSPLIGARTADLQRQEAEPEKEEEEEGSVQSELASGVSVQRQIAEEEEGEEFVQETHAPGEPIGIDLNEQPASASERCELSIGPTMPLVQRNEAESDDEDREGLELRGFGE